jgi:membrane dipeptidase
MSVRFVLHDCVAGADARLPTRASQAAQQVAFSVENSPHRGHDRAMKTPLIDTLQYANFSPAIFRQMREGGVDAVHVTIAYHENFREMVLNLERWNRWFEEYPDLIFKGSTGADVRLAQASGRTAIFFGFQNPSPIEDDIGLVEICHQLGIRFMQLTYNNQSLLATGCYEAEDSGLTRMGREVVREMNRVGIVVDMSHSGERSTLEAIDHSTRPIAITHANPHWWHAALRNKSDTVLKALTGAGGMLGFSVYPHHLAGGPDCTLEGFCQMIAESAGRYGAQHLGIGTDLCQDQPDSIVTWMRVGRWTKGVDYGEGSAGNAGFPPMPAWFNDNRDFGNIRAGLLKTGLSETEVDGIMGGNWQRFYDQGFGPA